MEKNNMEQENVNLNENINETATSEENNETPNAEAQNAEAEEVKEKTPEEVIADLESQLAAQKDAYLRLMADFENYRKNQLKKTQELIQYGGEDTIKRLLPVIDDFDRAISSLASSDDINGVREGVDLIYQKFQKFLEQSGVELIPATQGADFDDNVHDAVTMFPAPVPELKGKVVDCVTKGYKLKDKVIRHAKVVVGQ